MRGNPTEKEEKERVEGQSHEENSSVETETAKLVILVNNTVEEFNYISLHKSWKSRTNRP
jgi:hypothetical protein